MQNRNIAFFTEAGYQRGLGHLIRTATIERKFQSLGFNTFLFLDSNVNLDKKIRRINYFSWDTLNIIRRFDIIFIDSYSAALPVYEKISNSCKTVVYIDDFRRIEYPGGIILNFAPDAEKYFYYEKKEKHTHLLGINYVPLREELLAINRKPEESIFIMLGGNDIKNLTLEIVETIKNLPLKKFVVTNNLNVVKQLNRYLGVHVLYNSSDEQLFDAMCKSKVAISTASMGAYELAYLKIPTIILAVSQNQVGGIPQYINHNLAQKMVSIEVKTWKQDLLSHIKNLCAPDNQFIENKLDGSGSDNIVNSVLQLAS